MGSSINYAVKTKRKQFVTIRRKMLMRISCFAGSAEIGTHSCHRSRPSFLISIWRHVSDLIKKRTDSSYIADQDSGGWYERNEFSLLTLDTILPPIKVLWANSQSPWLSLASAITLKTSLAANSGRESGWSIAVRDWAQRPPNSKKESRSNRAERIPNLFIEDWWKNAW